MNCASELSYMRDVYVGIMAMRRVFSLTTIALILGVMNQYQQSVAISLDFSEDVVEDNENSFSSSTGQEQTRTPHEALPTPQEAIPTPQEAIRITQEETSTSQPVTATAQEEIPTTQDVAFSSQSEIPNNSLVKNNTFTKSTSIDSKMRTATDFKTSGNKLTFTDRSYVPAMTAVCTVIGLLVLFLICLIGTHQIKSKQTTRRKKLMFHKKITVHSQYAASHRCLMKS